MVFKEKVQGNSLNQSDRVGKPLVHTWFLRGSAKLDWMEDQINDI